MKWYALIVITFIVMASISSMYEDKKSFSYRCLNLKDSLIYSRNLRGYFKAGDVIKYDNTKYLVLDTLIFY